MPGITSSKIGTLEGNEVVQVEFDPAQTKLSTIISALKQQNSFYSVEPKNANPQFVDSKYTLHALHPELYYLDLTEAQAMALNSWSYFGGAMPDVLTTEQKQSLARLKAVLTRRSASSLRPIRTGEGLESYRKQLLRWLEE